MAEHKRNKAGLHKGISSIFKGVLIPQADRGQEPSGPPAPERTDCTGPKQPAPETQKTEAPKVYQATQTLPKTAPEHTVTGPKQPTPETQKTQTPKTYQAAQTLPKAAPEHTVTGPKQPAQETQKPQTPKTYQAAQTLPKAAKEHTAYTKPKQPAPEPQKTQAQKPYQVTQSLPKAAPAQKPKADTDDIKKYASEKPATVKSDSKSFFQQIKNKLSKPKPGAGVSTTKQKATVVMIPLLFIVLIFMLFRGGVFGTSAGHIEAPVEDTASGVATAGANTKIDWEVPAPYPTTLRDPMRLVPVEIPQTGQTGQTETRKTIKLIVKGILYSEGNPSAVIGNSIVHEGETIRGVSIIKISIDSVEFEMNGKRWTQKVRQ